MASLARPGKTLLRALAIARALTRARPHGDLAAGLVRRVGQDLAAAPLADQHAEVTVWSAAGVDEAMAIPPGRPLRFLEGHGYLSGASSRACGQPRRLLLR